MSDWLKSLKKDLKGKKSEDLEEKSGDLVLRKDVNFLALEIEKILQILDKLAGEMQQEGLKIETKKVPFSAEEITRTMVAFKQRLWVERLYNLIIADYTQNIYFDLQLELEENVFGITVIIYYNVPKYKGERINLILGTDEYTTDDIENKTIKKDKLEDFFKKLLSRFILVADEYR